MVKTNPFETLDVDRRRFLKTTATGIAVAGAASLLPAHSAFAAKRDDIQPFKVAIPEEQLVECSPAAAGLKPLVCSPMHMLWLRRKRLKHVFTSSETHSYLSGLSDGPQVRCFLLALVC